MITIPQLDDVSVIDDTDEIMVTHSDGTTEKISGADMKADIVKDKIENNNGNAVTVNAVSTIMASSTTITGPQLGTGGNIKVLFTADITGSDDTTGLSITYNSSAKAVKVAKDGSLVDFVAAEISAGTYKYLQAYTALELVYNGTYFIIVGNPVVLSDTDYTIYANGKKVLDPVDSVADSNLHPVTSNAVADNFEYDLLWENNSPSSAFSPQTITAQTLGVDLSKYKSIKVYTRNNTGGGNYSFQEILKGIDSQIFVPAGTILYRKVSFTNTGIQFYEGNSVNTYAGGGIATNTAVIPIKIYGVK